MASYELSPMLICGAFINTVERMGQDQVCQQLRADLRSKVAEIVEGDRPLDSITLHANAQVVIEPFMVKVLCDAYSEAKQGRERVQSGELTLDELLASIAGKGA